MAKVRLPLLSGDASGAVGKLLTFRRGGHVTLYSKPVTPPSGVAAEYSEMMGFIMRALTEVGSWLRMWGEPRLQGRWMAEVVGFALGERYRASDGWAALWDVMEPEDRDYWAQLATLAGYAPTDARVYMITCAGFWWLVKDLVYFRSDFEWPVLPQKVFLVGILWKVGIP